MATIIHIRCGILIMILTGTSIAQNTSEKNLIPSPDDAVLAYFKKEGERLVKCDDNMWINGGSSFIDQESISLPSGGLVERLFLSITSDAKLLLISSSIDSETNTHELGLVPPSYHAMVWTKDKGWQIALEKGGKEIIICGELDSIRTRNGRNEYGFYWYGRGRGANPGVDVMTVIDGNLQVVETSRRDLNVFDGEEAPTSKNLELTDKDFPWEWITLADLVNGKPWQMKKSLPQDQKIAALINKTPGISKKKFVSWFMAENKK